MTLTSLEFKLVLSMSNRPNEVVSDQEIHAVSYGFRTQNRSTANQFYIVDTNGGKKGPAGCGQDLKSRSKKKRLCQPDGINGRPRRWFDPMGKRLDDGPHVCQPDLTTVPSHPL